MHFFLTKCNFLPFLLLPFFFIAWCKIIWIDNCLHISSHLGSLNIILVCVHTNRKGLFYHCFACSNKKHLSGAAVCIHFWQLSQRVSQIACIACSLVMFAFSGTKSFWNLKYANDWSVFFTNTKYHRWFLLSRSIFFFLKLVFILYTYLSLTPSGNCSMNAFEGGWKDNLWDFSSWYVAIKLRKSKIRKAVPY